MREMCSRLSAILDLTRRSDAEISRVLGYANSATLARMRRGEAFLDPERLAAFAQIAICDEAHPNLHWVLTGQGPPLTGSTRSREIEATEALIQKITSDSVLVGTKST